MQVGIPRDEALREILEEGRLLESRAYRRPQSRRSRQSVHQPRAIDVVRTERRVGPYTRAQGQRGPPPPRDEQRLREVAGVVALHADRIGKVAVRSAEVAGAALALVFVLDASGP